LSAYGIAIHRHNSEIQQELDLCTGKKNNFQFTPHLTPMFRGILSTIYVDLKKGVTKNKINSVLNNYFKKEIFVNVAKPNTLLSTNDVINTNKCIISVCKSKHKKKLIILSVIDNLIKGGSGQAVQSMNILYNLNENEGLNA
jgi:N-acetyl-gamma-glutamyl-phosphate reductase